MEPPLLTASSAASCRRPRAVRSGLALGVIAAVLAGCGGQTVDREGFTTAERNDAQLALNGLQGSNIPTQILKFTVVAGSIPTCRIHLASRSPSTFDVYLFWTPRDRGYTYTWLTMALGEKASGDRFHLGTAPVSGTAAASSVNPAARLLSPSPTDRKHDLQALMAHAGNVFAKPAGRCQLLMNGYLKLLPAA
jgi:hypothetical protein